MSRDMDQSVDLLEDRAQLVAYFASGEKPRERRAFGTEHEKFVFRRNDLGLLSFEEEGGFADLFEALAQRFGWERSLDRGKVVALTRDGAALTLEPGGQFELSGGIKQTVFETAAELDAHFHEIKAVAGERLAFVLWGMNPFDGLDDVPWMPKARYEIMRNYLPTRGDLAHWMMKMTCTVQGNYDYMSEEDAADMVRVGFRVSPLVSALFANSPLRVGASADMQTYRCHIWTRTDPDRSGFPDFMYGDDWGYERYADYILDVPMFFIRRDNRAVDMSGRSFRDFMERGHDGMRATMGDFELHLSTAFPEVRMKKYIEVRGADAGSRAMLLALPALWKGIFYDADARAAAGQLLSFDSPDQHRACFEVARREGLRAQTPCGSVQDLARELVSLSRGGLDRLAAEAGHASEAEFLAPLDAMLEGGETCADQMLRTFAEVGGDRARMIAQWEL